MTPLALVLTLACGPTPYECAMARVRAHDFAGAVAVLEPEVAARPQDLKALNLLGIALTGAGRIPEANRRFAQALAAEPGFLPAAKNLAVNEFTEGKLEAAKARFERVVAEAPADAVAHVHLAEIHHRAGEHPAAVRHYRRSGDKVGENQAWVLHYAGSLLETDARADALAILGRLGAEDAEAAFEAGVLLGQAGAHAEAAGFFERAAKGHRDPAAAAYNQVLMLIRAGDHPAAIRAGETWLAQKPPTRGDLHNLLARAYLGAGRIQEAYDALRAATRLEPDAEENYLDLASICLEHQNLDLGLEIVDIGLRHRPRSARLQLQRGALLATKGLLDQAEKAFEAAASLGAEGSVAQVALAMAWMQNGQNARAVALMREHTRAAGSGYLAFYVLGLALMRSGAEPGQPEEAEAAAAFEAAVRLKPDHFPSRTELGKLFAKRGDLTQAVAHLEQAVAGDAESVAAAYALAQAYRRSGKPERAAEMLARVDKLNAAQREPGAADELRRTVLRIVRELN